MSEATVAAVMTPFPYAIRRSASLAEAAAQMEKHGIHHLPVKDGNNVVGLLHESDLRIAARLRVEATRVDAVCEPDPLRVQTEAPLEQVVKTMASRRRNATLVFGGQCLVGILTATDVCRLLGESLAGRPLAKTRRPDQRPVFASAY